MPADAPAGPQPLLRIEPTPDCPRNSEGSVLPLADGRLLLAYSRFTGGPHDESRAHLSCRQSADGGRTWSADRVLQETVGRMNVMSVSLLRLASGEALLAYMVKNAWDDCRAFVRRSRDDLATLDDPVCATPQRLYHVFNNDRLVQLSTGRLIVPAALHSCADGTVRTWSPRASATCYLSDDEGRTWRRARSVLSLPLDAATQAGLQEPGVIELTDGQLMLWARTDLGSQYQSFSDDGGETWSPPQPGPLVSPLSPASIRRMPWTGDLLAVWNDHSGRHQFPEGRRTPLCTAVSRDDGASWSPSRVLEGDPDGWYCYTSITFTADAVLLSYCAGDSQVGGLNRLKLVRVPREWLRDTS